MNLTLNLGVVRSFFDDACRFISAAFGAVARFFDRLVSPPPRPAPAPEPAPVAQPGPAAGPEPVPEPRTPEPRQDTIRKRLDDKDPDRARKRHGNDDGRRAYRDFRSVMRDDDDDGLPYVPTPLDPEPLCIPMPRTWREDLSYVINPFAIAGCTSYTAQYGSIGTCTRQSEVIANNFNGCFAHLFVGTPDSGKSYIDGVYFENALLPNRYQNILEAPLCAISFGYGRHGGGSHMAEQLTSRYPNRNPKEVRTLVYDHGTLPEGINDVVGLTVSRQVRSMRKEHRHCQVLDIKFPCRQLGIDNLKKLMIMNDKDDSLVSEEICDLVDSLPKDFVKSDLIEAALNYKFRNSYIKRVVLKRLKMAFKLIDDRRDIRGLIKPGRLIVIDIRDMWLPWNKAMKVFQVLLDILVMGEEKPPCNLLLVIDEAHKFLVDAGVREKVEHIIKERRHLGTSVVMSSQSPTAIPHSTLAELDGVGLFRTDSDRIIRHLSQDFVAFKDLTAQDTAGLKDGQMYFWAQKWYVPGEPGSLDGYLLKIQVRPRMSHHGGATRTAVPT